MTDHPRKEVAYFDKKSTEYRAEYDRETPEGYSFRIRREKVLALVPEGASVLDIASGPGVMVKGLRAKHCNVTLLDAAPAMIARAKEEFPDVRAVVGDAYKLLFSDGEFDVALAMGLIEYLEHEDAFLNEAKRILKPGGSLIITFPNYWSPWRVFNRLALALLSLFGHRSDKNNVTHREYSLVQARALLAEHGFKPDYVVYYNFKLVPYPFDVWLPRLTVMQSRILEVLDRTPLAFLGTGFIVRATHE